MNDAMNGSNCMKDDPIEVDSDSKDSKRSETASSAKKKQSRGREGVILLRPYFSSGQ